MNYLEIVFQWLLGASLRASILAVVILGIQFVLRRWLSAGWRHALWLPMLVVLVLPVLPEAPFGLFPRRETKSAPLVDAMVVPDGLSAQKIQPARPIASETTRDPDMPVASEHHTTAPMHLLAIAWFAGACGLIAAGLIGYRRNMQQFRLNAVSPEADLQTAIDKASREAGLRRVPQTWVSPAVASPAVTGLIQPLLLLPTGYPGAFSATEARLILLHELTHLKRMDLPLNWLSCVLQALHWFNPLLWIAWRRMRADREAACDARVLAIDSVDRRAEYGGALLKLQCVLPTRTLSIGFVGIFERGAEIKSRIREIATYRPRSYAWQAVGAVTFALLMLFGVTKGHQADPPATVRDSSGSVDPNVPVKDAGKEIEGKLNSIIVPEVHFEDVSLTEAVDFLRNRAAELDSMEPDPAKRGISFIVRSHAAKDGKVPAEPRIAELKLRKVSIAAVLKCICATTLYRYTVDDSAVTLEPQDVSGTSHNSSYELKKAVSNQEKKVEESRK